MAVDTAAPLIGLLSIPMRVGVSLLHGNLPGSPSIWPVTPRHTAWKRARGRQRDYDENRDPGAPLMTAEPSSVAPARGLRVLIVEDESLVSLFLQGVLQDLGHTVSGVAPSL